MDYRRVSGRFRKAFLFSFLFFRVLACQQPAEAFTSKVEHDWSYGASGRRGLAMQQVIPRLMARLGLQPTGGFNPLSSEESFLDKILHFYNAKACDENRIVCLGIILHHLEAFTSEAFTSEAFTSKAANGMVIDEVVDDIIVSLQAVVVGRRLLQAEPESWLKKRHLVLLLLGVTFCVTLYVAYRFYKGKREAEQRVEDRVRELQQHMHEAAQQQEATSLLQGSFEEKVRKVEELEGLMERGNQALKKQKDINKRKGGLLKKEKDRCKRLFKCYKELLKGVKEAGEEVDAVIKKKDRRIKKLEKGNEELEEKNEKLVNFAAGLKRIGDVNYRLNKSRIEREKQSLLKDKEKIARLLRSQEKMQEEWREEERRKKQKQEEAEKKTEEGGFMSWVGRNASAIIGGGCDVARTFSYCYSKSDGGGAASGYTQNNYYSFVKKGATSKYS